MKILVCISKTPDTTAKIAFADGGKKFEEAGVQWIINPGGTGNIPNALVLGAQMNVTF